MKIVQILMSTFNGETYLREQLDSILEQDCERKGIAGVRILVRDDGSVDSTPEILQEYKERFPEKLDWIQGKNCGVIRSFFELFRLADTSVDYYALSDQDDYWMPEKVSCGIGALEELSEDVPTLYCCRPKLVDAELLELPDDIKRPAVRQSFGNALIENVVTGCTTMFNPLLLKLLNGELPEFTVMHDRWMYLVASCFGTVLYDETPHICYRQHGGNVVGTSSSRLAELGERLARFRGKKRDISRQTAEFIRIYGDLAEERLKPYQNDPKTLDCLRLAKALLNARSSFWKRLQLIRAGGLYRQRKGDNFVFKGLILLGWY